MALTINEIIKLKKDPIGGMDNLFEFMSEMALRHAQWFYNVHKTIDSEEKPKAYSYQNKKYQLCRQVVQLDTNALRALYNMLIVLLGNKTYTYEQMIHTDFAWETAVEEVIPRAFEIVADIKIPEAQEYETVPL